LQELDAIFDPVLDLVAHLSRPAIASMTRAETSR
jgi:hypothetical protein